MLPNAGMRRAVREHDAVAAEATVVRLVAEIAAIRPEHLALRVRLLDALVDPVPDETALQSMRRLDQVPIVLQAAVRVAHRVRVLAHHQWLVAAIAACELGELR